MSKEQRYALEFTPAAVRDLKKLDPFVRRKIVDDLEKLGNEPRPHGVEKLEAKEKLYRVYVGPGKDFRAIYQILDEKLLLLIVKVGDRKEVYRRLK